MISTSNQSPRLFVGGLPFGFGESQLLKLFVPFGRVIDIRIIRDNRGKSRGLGYVEFENDSQALEAKEKLNKTHVNPERTIIVDFSRPDPAPDKAPQNDQFPKKYQPAPRRLGPHGRRHRPSF